MRKPTPETILLLIAIAVLVGGAAYITSMIIEIMELTNG